MVSPDIDSMLHIGGINFKGKLRLVVVVIQSIKLFMVNIFMFLDPKLILIRRLCNVWPCHLYIIVNKLTAQVLKTHIMLRCTMGDVLHLQT